MGAAMTGGIWSKGSLMGLRLGQFVSLLIASTGSSSSELAGRGIDAPTSQSFAKYVLLALVYGSYRRKPMFGKFAGVATCVAGLIFVVFLDILTLLGYCVEGNERLLVYEYMSEGTLGQHLFDLKDSGYCAITWKQRLSIALDVARGIEFLHSLAQESFIHGDLKPSNILLDKDLRAKVSEFGLVMPADLSMDAVEYECGYGRRKKEFGSVRLMNLVGACWVVEDV